MPKQSKEKNPRPENTGKWKKIVLNRWFLIGVGVLLIYTLLGFFLTPRLVTNFMTDFGQNVLKRHISVREVNINPFIFTLEAKDFFLAEEDGRPIVRFQRLFVDFELSSLFRWAWTFADISLEEPSLFVEIRKDGRLNLAALADSLPETEEPPPEEKESSPPRLVIQHAAILDGSFTFSDQSKATPAQETLKPLNLEFKDISTLPERKGPYTIRAELPGGGTIGWQGEVSLQPIFSEGILSVTNFKLASPWKFVQDDLRLTQPQGKVDLRTTYRFEYRDQASHLICTDSYFKLTGLKLVEKGPAVPLVTLETVEILDAVFDLEKRLITVPEIGVRNGKVSASVTEKGVLNWQTLAIPKKSPKKAASPPPEPATDDQPWQLKVDAVKVENVAVSYKDGSRTKPLALNVGGFNLTLNAAAEFGGDEPEAAINDLRVNLRDVALSSGGEDTPLIKLDTLSLNDGRVDVGARTIQLGRVEISGGESRIVRGKEGRIHLVEAFAPADLGMETAETEKPAGSPWSFRLDTFALNNYKTLLEDHTFSSPVQYTFQDIRATVRKISNDGKTPMEFDADLQVAQGGKAKFNGQVGSLGANAEANVEISGLSLMPLQPAVTEFSTLALKSGNVSATAKMKYEGAESGPKVRVDGAVRVDRFRLNQASSNERLLEWRTLSARGIRFGLSPDDLRIRKVRLLEPGAKIVISKERRLNLAEAIKTPDGEKAEKPSSPPEKGKKSKMFPVNIGSVRVEKGVVDFSDLSLVLPFATRVTDFKGGLVNISSAATSRSPVKFDGRVGKYGLATMEGSLSPISPKDFTDLKVVFQNVEMQTFSPYSATFAGRKIASGTLNLNLGYKIENSQLLGDNGVVLERFTLGERVEAPDAVSLPLDLAIALLTDANGVIDVAVPVSGDLDDPEFSYGHVIWQAFLNLITKIVTSPFRALGGLFGEGEEQVDAIGFNPGSSRLLPPEQEKLRKVAHALEKRPQLRLVVLGRFDPETDGKALRIERVKRSLAAEMKEDLPPEEEPGPIAFDKAKIQRSLEKLLEKRNGKKAVDEFQAEYEKTTGKEAKRMNPALGIFGVESPDTAFYQALFDELVRLEPLDEKPLRYLAQKRAVAIAEDLKTTVGLDEQRVAVGDTAAAEKASKKTIATRLQLDVLKPAPQ